MIPQKQLSLADIFEDCKNIHDSDKPQFLSLLEKHIDLDEIIPTSFFNHYYAATGRNRKYPLTAMLWALIIQRLFSIPTDSLLQRLFLLFSVAALVKGKGMAAVLINSALVPVWKALIIQHLHNAA